MDEALAPLLPGGGLRRGTSLTIHGHGSLTLATALAAESSRRGGWVVAVGMAELGVSALAERNPCLERWALIDLADAAERGRGARVSADVLGAVVSGFDLVLLGSGVRAGAVTARRLSARLREHGAVLIWVLGASVPASSSASAYFGAGLQPELRLSIERPQWTGIGDGHGRLLARQAEVVVSGRGAAARSRRMLMWLPFTDGRVARVRPGEALKNMPSHAHDQEQQDHEQLLAV